MSGAETRHIFLFQWHLIDLDSTRHDIDNLIFLSKKRKLSHTLTTYSLIRKYDFKLSLILNRTIKKTADRNQRFLSSEDKNNLFVTLTFVFSQPALTDTD